MIGPKDLSAIRQELKRALTAAGQDPLRWLERRVAAPERQGTAASGESEVLHSLRRFLEATAPRKRHERRVGMKK